MLNPGDCFFLMQIYILLLLDVFVKWWGLNFGENSQALHNKYWLTHLQSEFIAVYLSFLCLSWYVLTHHISLDNVTNMWKLKEARKMLEIWVALAGISNTSRHTFNIPSACITVQRCKWHCCISFTKYLWHSKLETLQKCWNLIVIFACAFFSR